MAAVHIIASATAKKLNDCCEHIKKTLQRCFRTLSRNAETKDFARLTSHPVQGWTGKNKAFCSRGTQNGRRVIKVNIAIVATNYIPDCNASLFYPGLGRHFSVGSLNFF